MEITICIISIIIVPSQPTDFKGEAKSETSVLLSWNPPTQTGQDNQIVGYELLYKKGDDKEEVRTCRWQTPSLVPEFMSLSLLGLIV